MPEIVRIILGALISIAPYAVLVFIPFWGQLKMSKPKFWIVIAVFLIVYLCAEVTIPNADIFKANYRLVQLYIIVLMGVCFIFYFVIVKAQFSKLLYVFFVVATYNLYVTSLIHFALARFRLQDYEDYYPASATLIHAALLAVTMPFVIRFFIKHVRPSMPGAANPAWKYMWIIPCILLAVVFIFSNAYVKPLIASWEYASIILLLGLGSFLIYYVVIKMIEQTEKNDKLLLGVSMSEKQIALQSKQYENLQAQIAETQVARHDMRHQLAAIGRLTGEEKVKSYVSELLGSLPEASEQGYCENHAVNAVVTHYLAAAKRVGIQTDVRLVIPEKAGCVSEMDLCVIMGNLLENAVEACRRMEHGERFLRARSGVVGDYLSMIVENSFDGLWNEQDGAYLSRKRDGGETPREGAGLSSVKAVCAKYDGLAKVEVTGNVWCSSALVDMGGTTDEGTANG